MTGRHTTSVQTTWASLQQKRAELAKRLRNAARLPRRVPHRPQDLYLWHRQQQTQTAAASLRCHATGKRFCHLQGSSAAGACRSSGRRQMPRRPAVRCCRCWRRRPQPWRCRPLWRLRRRRRPQRRPLQHRHPQAARRTGASGRPAGRLSSRPP